MIDELILKLNAQTKAERLDALRRLKKAYEDGILSAAPISDNVNNHIHTFYSFSPYSPSGAAFSAWRSGLATAGIMDHDSLSGAEEFIEAGEIIGIATTVGFECRCQMTGTPFEGRRLNNPDQISVAYMAMHGVPHQNIGKIQEFLKPLREKRNTRNRAMLSKLNKLITPLELVFERDVAPLSRSHEGGSITERHILFALSETLMDKIGRGEALLGYLEDTLKVSVSGSVKQKLLDTGNSMYAYYLLGALKSELVAQFYIDAADECPSIAEFIKLGEETGAIPAYAYLGDVGDSVTGDKKTQTFEDAYLDELVQWLAGAGVKAITYMPTRNTLPQLTRLMELCRKFGLFQISGEDINSPFQSFICSALEKPEFKHLIESTWALIGHERAATARLEGGMFSRETVGRLPDLDERIKVFAQSGQL